jgi:hypothetical protein
MIIIWGEGNYGKVDVVPNLCYVTTRFFHLYYVPLLPLGSYVVVAGSEEGNGFRGVRTRLSFKSILAGWIRAALILSVVVGTLVGLVALVDHLDNRKAPSTDALVVPWALAVLSVFAYWVTHRSARAGYARALALGAELGLPPPLVEKCLLGEPPEPSAPEATSGESTLKDAPTG